MRFLFIRHGETDWNAKGLMQGQTDIPLNEKGEEQARLAAERLKTFSIVKIVASPQVRAYRTAEIISTSFGISGIHREHDLRERGFGQYEGSPFSEFPVGLLYGAAEEMQKDVEPFTNVGQRAKGAVERWLDGHDHETGSVLFVAHGAVFVALHQILECGPHFRIQNAQPFEFSRQTDGRWACAAI